MRGFQSYTVKEHIVLESKTGDPKDTNTEEQPDTVVPHGKGNARMEGSAVTAELPSLSWNVIILEKQKN